MLPQSDATNKHKHFSNSTNENFSFIAPQNLDDLLAILFVQNIFNPSNFSSANTSNSISRPDAEQTIVLIASMLLTSCKSAEGHFFVKLSEFANKKIAIPPYSLKKIVTHLNNERDIKGQTELLSQLENLEIISIDCVDEFSEKTETVTPSNSEEFELSIDENSLENYRNKQNDTTSKENLKNNNEPDALQRFYVVKFPNEQIWLQLLAQTRGVNNNPQNAENKSGLINSATHEIVPQEPTEDYWLLLKNNYLYLKKNRNIEVQLAALIKKKIAKKKIDVVTGGPGTGKTTKIFELLYNYLLSHLQDFLKSPKVTDEHLLSAAAIAQTLPCIALTAFTGKAVARLKTSLQTSLQINKKTKLNQGDKTILTNKKIQGVLMLIEDAITNTKTLHRLVGISQDLKNIKVRSDLLLLDVLVIDEASMVPHEIVLNLLLSTASNCHFVIVGDPFQLPSINSGNFLSDIALPAVLATPRANNTNSHKKDHLLHAFKHLQGENFRFSGNSALGRVAKYMEEIFSGQAKASVALFKKAIASMEQEPSPELLHAGNSENNLFLLKSTNDAQGEDATNTTDTSMQKNALSPPVETLVLKEFLPHFENILIKAKNARHVDSATLAEKLLKLFRSRIILTATKNGENSAMAVQHTLQKALTSRGFKSARTNKIVGGRIFMVSKNDYYHDVWNGDIGIALRDASGALRLYFQKELNPQIDKNGILLSGNEKYWQKHISPLYALTIHKSQGDEFSEVFAVFPPAHRFLTMQNPTFLSRQLLYTALTRAKKKIWLYVEDKVLDAMLHCSSEKNCSLQNEIWN